ncbi:MAG: NADH-quinone oxidoreductase subunit A [Acidobacteriota bacterium]|nr:NADH-quinone oxidoreductase subunit A [Acidobacteriota bacterium]
MTALVVSFAVFGFLALVMLSVNAALGPRRRSNPAQQTRFECGSPELQEGIRPFPVKFSLVAFLFLLLDVEAAFYFPWALILREIKGPALAAMIFYTAILAAGLAYAWAKGAFDWD